MPGTFIPFVDCVQSNIQFDLDGVPGENVMGFHLIAGGPPTPSDMATLNTTILTDLLTALATLQTSSMVYRNIHTIDLDSLTGPVQDDPLTLVGSAIGQAMPNQVAMTVTFLTDLRGRSYQGRNFIAGLMVGEDASNIAWGPTVLAAVLSAFEAFDTSLPATGWEHVVLSRANGGVPRVTGHAQAVVGYRPNAPIHTQRRRLT